MTRDIEDLATLDRLLTDDNAQRNREAVCSVIPSALAANGQRLSIDARLSGEPARQGFAVMTEMAAELAMGATALFRQELWYPGAAVVRQLLECGYLISLASERPEEAERWFTSSRTEILQRFMPKAMRARASHDFRTAEYETHCDWGGHPNPAGRHLLRNHDEWEFTSRRTHWVDLALHVSETWAWFVDALPLYDPRLDPESPLYAPPRTPDGGAEVRRALSEWHEHDQLAGRLSPREA
jgi:hypothetical protein